MALILSIADIRDIVIVVYGIIGIVVLLIIAAAAVGIFFLLKGLIGTVREMLNDSIKPALESVKGAAESVRGTTDFVGKTTVTPIIKTYSALAGVRKGLSVLTSFSGRKAK